MSNTGMLMSQETGQTRPTQQHVSATWSQVDELIDEPGTSAITSQGSKGSLHQNGDESKNDTSGREAWPTLKALAKGWRKLTWFKSNTNSLEDNGTVWNSLEREGLYPTSGSASKSSKYEAKETPKKRKKCNMCEECLSEFLDIIEKKEDVQEEKKPVQQKDDSYYERRKKINRAAKKSRDARRLRENQIAQRASTLEHENAVLRGQNFSLREEAQSLKQLLIGLQPRNSGTPALEAKDRHLRNRTITGATDAPRPSYLSFHEPDLSTWIPNFPRRKNMRSSHTEG